MQLSSTGKAAQSRSSIVVMTGTELALQTQAREFRPITLIVYSSASIGRTEPVRANLAEQVWGWPLSNIWRRPMAEKLPSSRGLVREPNSRSSFLGLPITPRNGSVHSMQQSRMRSLLSGKAGGVLRVLQIL